MQRASKQVGGTRQDYYERGHSTEAIRTRDRKPAIRRLSFLSLSEYDTEPRSLGYTERARRRRHTPQAKQK